MNQIKLASFSKKEWVIFKSIFYGSSERCKTMIIIYAKHIGQLQTYFWQVLSRKVCTSFFLPLASVLSQHQVHRWVQGNCSLLEFWFWASINRSFKKGFVSHLWADLQIFNHSKKARLRWTFQGNRLTPWSPFCEHFSKKRKPFLSRSALVSMPFFSLQNSVFFPISILGNIFFWKVNHSVWK